MCGVFDKLVEEQNNVEWTHLALAADRSAKLIGWAGILVAASVAGLLLLYFGLS